MPMRSVWIAGLTAVSILGGCSGSPGDEAAILAVADIEQSRIGVSTGSSGEAYAIRRFTSARVLGFDDTMDAVAALKSGQLDGVIATLPTTIQLVKMNPDLTFLGDRLINEDTAIAVRKGNTALLQQLDEAITAFEADGTLADMRRRWFKIDTSPYVVPDIPVATGGPVLKVGVAATREPVSFIDSNGVVTGHDGELVRRIAQRLGRPIEFQDMRIAALIPSLQSGKVDVIVTGLSYTAERARAVDFSKPYYANAQVLVVRRTAKHTPPVIPDISGAGGAQQSAPAPSPATQGETGAGWRSAADVENLQIAVLLGGATETFVSGQWKQATGLAFQSTSDQLLAVRTGKADAGISDTGPLLEALTTMPELAVFGDPVMAFDLGVGFSRESAQLRQQFDDFLARLEADGTLADMRRRWIDEKGRAMPMLPPAPAGEPIVVGTATEGLPYEALVENEIVGFDIEMMERFGRAIGRPVRFENMVFSSLIAAVASGKVDAIAASIFVTEERKKLIDFSRGYFKSTASVFALRSKVAPDVALPKLAGEPTVSAAAGAQSATAVPAEPSLWESTVQGFRNNLIAEQRYLLIWDGLKVTAVLSILSALLGTAIGAVVCFMRMSPLPTLQYPARTFISVLRGTPVLVLLMIIFYVVFASVDIDPVLVATIAFGLNFGAYAAEIFRTGIETVDKGQTEAGIAMGFTRVQAFLNVVLPQTVQRILPVYKGEFISLVKTTSIVGYIAVQDLTKASDVIRSRTFDAFFPLIMVAVLYFLVSWVLLQALEYLERQTDPKARRARAVKA